MRAIQRIYLEKQGVVAQRGNHVAGNQGVVINMGRYGGEVSDWAVAEVITWDRELSDGEMEAVCAYMRAVLEQVREDGNGLSLDGCIIELVVDAVLDCINYIRQEGFNEWC